MKVREIMTADVSSCQPETSMAEIAGAMWNQDCGAIPVVTSEGRVVGMITDRDICMAVVTKGRTADRIAAREVSGGEVYTCLPDDDVSVALETMKARQVRRLPVVNREGRLTGILSMNDIALHSEGKRGVPPDRVVTTLKAICAHRHAPAGAA